MKPDRNIVQDPTRNFDKELKAILSHDLNRFKAERGSFLNKPSNGNKDRMVA